MRLVRGADGTVIIDARGTAAGRGAYLCGEAACVERGLRRDRLAHAFRTGCRVPADLGAGILAAARAGDAAARASVE